MSATTPPRPQPPRILLEGRPGIGKTTVVVRLAELVRGAGIPLAGFTTREVRRGGARAGFLVEALDGPSATLADVRLPGPPRVGRYGVDLAAFERVALPALERAVEGAVVLVDELGKMELASERFRARFSELLDAGLPLVATVHLARHPFTDALRSRPGVEVIVVSHGNRSRLPAELAARLRSGRLGPGR